MKPAAQFEREWYQANWPGDHKSESEAAGPFKGEWMLADLVRAAQADALETAAKECEGGDAEYTAEDCATVIRGLRAELLVEDPL